MEVFYKGGCDNIDANEFDNRYNEGLGIGLTQEQAIKKCIEHFAQNNRGIKMRKTVIFDSDKYEQRCMEHPSDVPFPERLAKEYNGLPFELFNEWMRDCELGLADEDVHVFEWDTEDFDEEGNRKVGSRFKRKE